MKNSRRLLLPVILLLAAALAFLLRGVFDALVIYPLAKLWFMLRGYYGAMAQSAYWPLILILVLLLGLSGLRIVEWNVQLGREKKMELRGEVHQTAFWLERLERQNPYPRWYVARTLADLAVDILNRRGAAEGRSLRLQGPGWAPPPEVQKYLEIALQSNPATFTKMLDASRIAVPNVETVIQYLECFVENSR